MMEGYTFITLDAHIGDTGDNNSVSIVDENMVLVQNLIHVIPLSIYIYITHSSFSLLL